MLTILSQGGNMNGQSFGHACIDMACAAS